MPASEGSEGMGKQYTLDEHEESIRLRNAWEHTLKVLANEVPKAHLNKFVRPLIPISFNNGVIEMHAAGAFVAEWVRSKYLGRLQEVLGDSLGEEVTIEFHTVARDRSESSVAPAAVATSTIRADEPSFRPNPKYRFESLVVGQCNRMAVAGARAVASEPGARMNPLFIYGSSGLGKTHLMHAIAHDILQRDPRAKVSYVPAQFFAEEYVQAVQSNRIDQFRRSQRSVNVWLVDDIQSIIGRERTQEEVFHTFNYLHQLGRQIVLCADRAPRQLFSLDERLRSRFESGLLVDVQSPDTETRAAILLSKAAEESLNLSPEVALYLAGNVNGNVRVLEGALTRIAVMASLERTEITAELAKAVVEQYYQSMSHAKPGFRQVMEMVGKYYKISVAEIESPSRKAPVVHARHVAVYLMREISGDSWKHIGNQCGDRDHTSMMHAHQKISEMIERDRQFAGTITALMQDLAPN